MDSFNLHVRLTKRCNADCTYCSSYETNANEYMSEDDYIKSMNFIYKKMEDLNLAINRKHLSIMFVGGELLTLPEKKLSFFVNYANEYWKDKFETVVSGGQSNLIGSEEKVNRLFNLFNNKVSTSIDNFTEQRTVNGSSKKYKTIFIKNFDKIVINNRKVPAIIVIDEKSYDHINEELKIGNRKGYDITLRPVFNGGKEVNHLFNQKLEKLYDELFETWFLKQRIIVEPFYSFIQKRIRNKIDKSIFAYSGCPFQHNCATSSLNLEPNGDLYICLDMADSKQIKLGNTLSGDFDYEMWNTLKNRSLHLSKECYKCDYFNECQGGCMSEAIHHSNDIYGKTDYCNVWKNLFKKIDEKIAIHGIAKIENWLSYMNKEDL